MKTPTTFQVDAAELDVAAEREPLEAAGRLLADVDLARARREAAPLDEGQRVADLERQRADAAHRHVGRLVVGLPRQRDDHDQLGRRQRTAVAAARDLRQRLDQRQLRPQHARSRFPRSRPCAAGSRSRSSRSRPARRRKPCAIAIVITKTATTIAMPIAVIAAVPLRTIIERRL